MTKARSAAVIRNQTDDNTYGIPPWQTGAAPLTRPLFRLFPRVNSDAKAEAKTGSSTTTRFRELVEALATSN